ncbi:MAG TPA: adenosylhomocysteinase [Candidatus Dormibacteraeota bacterium]|nr:adenosylhomocysteinase [Candidatus Dormibacteraeota bacterium]
MVPHDVTDLGLADQGDQLIAWAAKEMPVLKLVRERFEKEKPLQGIRMSGCLHVTSETANLALALQAGGAELTLCASNPLSTQDPVAAALVRQHGISVFARKGEDNDLYYQHLRAAAVDARPQMTMDDGCDLVSLLHKGEGNIDEVIGGTEETTTGVIRLRAMEKAGVLRFPIVAVNEALTKHMFDNRYGTGQSTLDGIIRSTNVLLAGKNFVVCGYGWCGRGLASRANGMGAHVIVTEVDPTRALEAVMDGYRVMTLEEAAPIADFITTVTGDLNVIDRRHLEVMKDGAIVANSGHFNDEINITAMDDMSSRVKRVRPFVDEYQLHDGRRVYLLGEGRLINLTAAEGHPAAVMDMSFANQALSAEYVALNHKDLERKVYDVPLDIDREVARLKLDAMGIKIDVLTPEQEKYLASWESGT